MAETPRSDPIGALISLLKADTATNQLTGGRVYGGELPREVTDLMPVAAVVVRYAGGFDIHGQGWNEYGDFRVDVVCYGTHPQAASDLYNLTHPVLKQLRRRKVDNVLLHWARSAGGPLSRREPDTEWPFCLRPWQVLAAEIPA